jgi:hypothetical protein
MNLRNSVWLCAAGAFLAAASARAGEVDKFLPDDTEMVVSVNVRQILDSELFKKNVEDRAREALKNLEEAPDVLKELGFDPFTDVDRVIAARPSGVDQDRGLVIVHGRFDLDKFGAKAEKTAKSDPDILKIHKVANGENGAFLVYEVTPKEQAAPRFVALPNRSTLLVSPGKDYVVDAMKKEGAKDKAELKNKEIQGLLEGMNDKQGVSVAMVGSALTEGPGPRIKSLFEKVEAVGGGVTVGDEIKIEIAFSAKSADEAKEVKEGISTGLKQGKVLLAALALAGGPEIDALLDVANSLKVSVKDKTVILKGAVSAEVIQDALKKDK